MNNNAFFDFMRQELNLPNTLQADLFVSEVLFEYELSFAPVYERPVLGDVEIECPVYELISLEEMFHCHEEMPPDTDELELRCDENINDIVIPATDSSEVDDDVMTVDSAEEGTVQSDFTFA